MAIFFVQNLKNAGLNFKSCKKSIKILCKTNQKWRFYKKKHCLVHLHKELIYFCTCIFFPCAL